MNWYKIANMQLDFLSYNSDLEFKVLVNNKPYTYYHVFPPMANKIKWMIANPKIPGQVILQQLKPFSDPKLHDKLNPPKKTEPSGDLTYEEKQEMLDEFYEKDF